MKSEVMCLPEHLSALMRGDAYPHPVEEVRLIETHISWVLLTGEWAYKIKRPVAFPFVDLRSPERRAFFCEEELRLNRRFAPQLYVEVCDITESEGGARISGIGRAIDHAVKMLQFPTECGLDRLLLANAIAPEVLERFGAELADLHRELPLVDDNEPWGKAETVCRAVLENLSECERAARIFSRTEVPGSLRTTLEKRLARSKELLSIRRERGFVRECHGDLHARNVVLYDSELLAFDCMEFEPAFRWIDVAQEIAFLWMDLCRHGREAHAHAFLSGYLSQNGDYDGCALIRLYAAHCALVRAKIVALEAAQSNETPEIEAARSRFDGYMAWVRDSLAAKQPRLILMSGWSGSGKTWLAKRVAPRLGAIHLRSDVERKRLAGLAEVDRADSEILSGLYAREKSTQVYEHLATCASSCLAGGFTAVVDATFLMREDRAHFLQLAKRLHIEPVLIRCQAPEEVLRERIVGRQNEGGDPSDATLPVLEWQQSHADAVGEDEPFKVIDIDTNRADAVDMLLPP